MSSSRSTLAIKEGLLSPALLASSYGRSILINVAAGFLPSLRIETQIFQQLPETFHCGFQNAIWLWWLGVAFHWSEPKFRLGGTWHLIKRLGGRRIDNLASNGIFKAFTLPLVYPCVTWLNQASPHQLQPCTFSQWKAPTIIIYEYCLSPPSISIYNNKILWCLFSLLS